MFDIQKSKKLFKVQLIPFQPYTVAFFFEFYVLIKVFSKLPAPNMYNAVFWVASRFGNEISAVGLARCEFLTGNSRIVRSCGYGIVRRLGGT